MSTLLKYAPKFVTSRIPTEMKRMITIRTIILALCLSLIIGIGAADTKVDLVGYHISIGGDDDPWTVQTDTINISRTENLTCALVVLTSMDGAALRVNLVIPKEGCPEASYDGLRRVVIEDWREGMAKAGHKVNFSMVEMKYGDLGAQQPYFRINEGVGSNAYRTSICGVEAGYLGNEYIADDKFCATGIFFLEYLGTYYRHRGYGFNALLDNTEIS